MKIFERVYYSLIGKKVKTLLLLLVITLLGTFLSASFSIYQANQNLEKSVKENLNPVVVIEWKYRGNHYGIDDWNHEPEVDELADNLEKMENIVNKYRSDERIQVVENRYLLDTPYFYHLALVDENNKGVPILSTSYQHIYKNNEMVEEVPNPGTVWDHIVGIDYYNVACVENKTISMIDGRVFTKEEIENGENVFVYLTTQGKSPQIMMNYSKDGEHFRLSLNKAYITDYQDGVMYTVVKDLNYFKDMEMIGIGLQVDNGPSFKYHSRNIYIGNAIYVPVKTLDEISTELKKMAAEIGEEYPWYKSSTKYEGIKYLADTFIELKDADELSGLMFDLKMDCGNLVRNIYSYSDSYNDVQGITRSLNLIAIISLVVCSVASIILLSLIIQVFVNERKYEIGVYLSLGESKKNVITQILCEILLVGLLGISTSLFTGNMIGKSLSSDLLERQIKQHEEIHNGMSDQNNYEISQEEILDTYEVSITMEYIICVYAGGLVVLLLSSVYPMNSIMKMKAKKMLQ